MNHFLRKLKRKVISILFSTKENKKVTDYTRLGHAYYKRMVKPSRLLQLLVKVKRKWMDRPFKAGTRINGYTIVKPISIGTYGATYLVSDQNTGETVVLKHIRKSRKRDQKVYQFFQNEMDILAKMHHHRIPRFIQRFDVDGEPFYCMEYIEGVTLETLLYEQHYEFTIFEALQFLRKLVEIVAYLHKNNIIHRDIRISNVLYADGEPYLIDFGQARDIDNPDLDLYESNDHYDEAFRYSRLIRFESDFFLLGNLFLYMVYSRFIPKMEQQSWEEELNLAPQIMDLIRRMLQRDTAYSDISDLLSDIDNILYQNATA